VLFHAKYNNILSIVLFSMIIKLQIIFSLTQYWKENYLSIFLTLGQSYSQYLHNIFKKELLLSVKEMDVFLKKLCH